MIPCVHVPDLVIGPLPLHPFGLLVATGVLVGTWLATWRARKIGFDVDLLNSFITWMLAAGFVLSHVLDEIFYHPKEILARPWSLLFVWEGLSSFGGFIGGFVGIALWKYFYFDADKPGSLRGRFRRRKQVLPILPFADLILSVFPVAWVFGRSGCSVVHDHLGARAPEGAALAVAYGPGPKTEWMVTSSWKIEFIHGSIPRWDLGLLELLFTVCVALLFSLTWHKKLYTGTYAAVVCLVYAPVRFAMDTLRVTDAEGGDPRYGGLTPGQYAAAGLFAVGLFLAWKVRDMKRRGVDPALDVLASPEAPKKVEAAPKEAERAAT
jgi:phosphatidylglycerol:prolipoprotein diacylglycerol transferase